MIRAGTPFGSLPRMNLDLPYSQDTEFSKLLARQNRIDLTTAALELARDFYPQLDFEIVRRWIAERAAELARPLAHARNDRDLLGALTNCLAETHGINGSPEIYDQADGSFLNRVIEQKTGIPISLSVLYMGVSNTAGLRLRGVSAPGHFLTRYDGAEGPLFLDPFRGGMIQSLDETLVRVQSTTGLAPEVALSCLEKASSRAIILRMLNNLKVLFSRQENWTSACLIQNRLTALQPASYNERRDQAILTLHARQPGRAIDLLETCLQNCPRDERTMLQQKLAEARRQTAMCN